MTELFKCLVLLCAVSVVYAFTDVRDDVSWFKNGERIKNKFVSGVVNGILDPDCSDSIDGVDTQGECLSKLECTNSGGKSGAPCSLMGFCCVTEKTCGQTTSSLISYFVPPKTFQSDCPLTIKKYSANVCQIRLDFVKFDIAQPEQDGEEAYTCKKDKFTIKTLDKLLGIKSLCGKNTGQHIYIPLSKSDNQIKIAFNLETPRSTNADWKIKITQLECYKSGYEDLLSAPSKLMAIHNNLNNLKTKKNSKCFNCDLIAPPGCLQYYKNETGTFESFNYNGENGRYIGGLDYAICFKQTPDICGAKYTVEFLKMNSVNEEDNGTLDCLKRSEDDKNSKDYIRITEGKYGKKLQDLYCGSRIERGSTIIARPYEPLYVGVHTDDTNANAKENVEVGFKITYRLLKDACVLSSG